VLTAADSLEAMLMIERYRPSVVVLDLTAVGLDGTALVRKVREHHEFDAVHLVAMLAENGLQGGQELRELAGVAVFSKHTSIERLQGFVEAHLIRQAPPQRSQGGVESAAPA
jgi:DNA-binding response OmpR family regulator